WPGLSPRPTLAPPLASRPRPPGNVDSENIVPLPDRSAALLPGPRVLTVAGLDDHGSFWHPRRKPRLLRRLFGSLRGPAWRKRPRGLPRAARCAGERLRAAVRGGQGRARGGLRDGARAAAHRALRALGQGRRSFAGDARES